MKKLIITLLVLIPSISLGQENHINTGDLKSNGKANMADYKEIVDSLSEEELDSFLQDPKPADALDNSKPNIKDKAKNPHDFTDIFEELDAEDKKKKLVDFKDPSKNSDSKLRDKANVALGYAIAQDELKTNQDPKINLFKADKLLCTFTKANVFSWKGNNVERQESKEIFSLNFENINYKTRKALLKGNIGSSEVKMELTNSNLNFIEVTGLGGYNTTTISFINTSDPDEYVAVDVRNLCFPTALVTTQSIGRCKILSKSNKSDEKSTMYILRNTLISTLP